MDEELRKLRKLVTAIEVGTLIVVAINLAMIFIAINKDTTISRLTKKVEFLEKELKASKEKELKLLEEETKLLEIRNECTKMGYFNK